jgi:hypothetical protein
MLTVVQEVEEEGRGGPDEDAGDESQKKPFEDTVEEREKFADFLGGAVHGGNLLAETDPTSHGGGPKTRRRTVKA